ncbi:TfoX/Sxy family protein [Arthrobacter sp. M2012083]|uniref:TfoX/Sxy family protein n=1 Tax=Arthrobacter sp. M2012083 TaxID=1197706 RepID=UPI0002DC0334|nr:TfoX/Sxy family protein [Arthrobacter sp. M2012083]
MQMPKPSEADKERFRSVLPDHPDVVVKPMFGNLGAFVNGNMFAGLFGPTIGIRLSETDKAALEAEEVTQPFGPAERPMGGYIGLPEAWNDDPAQAEPWVARAFAHVAELPPKAPKTPKAKAPKN